MGLQEQRSVFSIIGGPLSMAIINPPTFLNNENFEFDEDGRSTRGFPLVAVTISRFVSGDKLVTQR